jgi:hypothetical protein
MIKKIILVIFILVLIVGVGYLIARLKTRSKSITPVVTTTEPSNVITDALNTTYTIDDQLASLINGSAQQSVATGSSGTINISVWSQPVLGDLNNDGNDDAALILVEQTGGSGTFYYLVAAIENPESGEAIGSNGVLLGDRISPQSISIDKGVITVKYLDRGPKEAMATPPSIETIKHFTLNGLALEEVKS